MNIIVAISTVWDGDMGVRLDKSNLKQTTSNRLKFLEKQGLSIESTTRVAITYDRKDYTRYRTVGKINGGDGMIIGNEVETADALVTTDINHALFLPVADCVGAVIYDPIKKVLMLSHLGRHSLEQQGGSTSIQHLIEKFQSNPVDLLIWLTPSPSAKTYPLYSFDDKSIKDVTIKQLMDAGVNTDNIHINPVDNSSDKNYFSHSEFLKGRQTIDGRFAIVAMMTD